MDFMFSNPTMLDDLDYLYKSDTARKLMFYYQVNWKNILIVSSKEWQISLRERAFAILKKSAMYSKLSVLNVVNICPEANYLVNLKILANINFLSDVCMHVCIDIVLAQGQLYYNPKSE